MTPEGLKYKDTSEFKEISLDESVTEMILYGNSISMTNVRGETKYYSVFGILFELMEDGDKCIQST